MDDFGLAPDSLEPHPGRISQKFSSVTSNGGSNGEIFHCTGDDEPPYYTSYGLSTYSHDTKRSQRSGVGSSAERRCLLDEFTERRKLKERTSSKGELFSKAESASRSVIPPKGLHTHVLNCSGLRPNRSQGICDPLNEIFDQRSARDVTSSREIPCRGSGLSIRDKVNLFPHVCGKDTISVPQPAESSTSSDQDFPATRVHHYKKKVHKNPRLKTTRRTRACNSRNCNDKNCGKLSRDSEDSSIFSKSDSEYKYSSTTSRVPKVSISTSTEILYEKSGSFKFIPPSAEGEIRPLKSALKISHPQGEKHYAESEVSRKSSKLRYQRHTDDNYRKSFVLNSHESGNYSSRPPGMFSNPRLSASTNHLPIYQATTQLEEDSDDQEIYDPSLPVIPIMSHKTSSSKSNSIISHNSKISNSKFISSLATNPRRATGSVTSSGRSGSTDLEDGITSFRRNTRKLFKNLAISNHGKALSKSMSNLSQLASEPTSDLASEALSDSMEDLTVVSPTLGNWHEALAMTKRLGWTLLLYHAVRNNYRPLQFARQLLKGSRSYVRAVADYQTRESRLLSFNKGDIIRVTSPEHYQDKGWLEGSVDGRTGLFPMEYVVPIGRAEARRAHKSNEEDLDPEMRNGGHRGLGTSGTGGRGDREAGAGSGGSTSSWGHHHNSTITATTTTTNTTALHQSAVTSTISNRVHHHHDDSGHSSGGEGGGGGGMSSGGEQRNGVGGETGGGSLGSLSKSPQPRDMLHHETMTSSQYSSSQFANDGKHSLLQFALKYFRMAKEQNLVAADGTLQTKDKSKKKKNSKDNGADWTWKEQVEMVKFTQSPLTASLLPLDPPTSQAAVEVFLCVMRYMGDYPMEAAQTEVPCVYTILTNCHLHEALRDELYCQLMKQTTSNKSSIPDSCQRGWRLFSIIAAYFTCSDILRPYLFKYLETNAYDKRRAFHGTAMVSLQNLRKTFKYGGRKNVPSIDEITALTAGRNSKREIYRLPGGTERVINTRSTSVVQDILEEMCLEISVTTPEEQEEFSMYCLVEGEAFTMPLARDEYILDITTELRKNNQMFYLIFCRSVWYCPLRLDTPLYIEVVFNQMAPDYLEGLLLVLPGEKLPQHLVMDISRIAALMHRAADLDFEPTVPEVKYLLPKQALVVREVKPHQWIAMVQEAWPDAAKLTTTQAKAQVLELLQHWELFGSAFFTVKRVLEGQETVDIILALNKRGVHFLDYDTHETLEHYSLSQVFGTRKVKSEDGHLYLDMKFGNLLHHRISRIQTIQAHEISRLFRQYISTEQRVTGGHDGDAPRDVTLSR